MEDAFRALNQHFQPDASDGKPDVLLDLRQQAVGEDYVCCILYLWNHDYINVSAGCFNHVNYVTIEKLCLDPIGTKGSNLPAKIESSKGLNQRYARGDFLRRSAAVFQVKDNLVRFAGRGFGHHLERMRGTSQLTAADSNGIGVIQWSCHCLSFHAG